MKKILLLGGSYGQLPAIDEAKKRGLYTILCDYLPDNPGARLVDEFHLVSTTDMEAVLTLAKGKHVDYVFAYASDPAALTAAFVSETLGLPGSSYKGVELLSNKDKFRRFLQGNAYNTPAFEVFDTGNLPEIESSRVPFPLVVKPIDSSDTKGVSLVTQRNQL
jgi:formate-dependent phosphoribosylglycinamide formyltransferase (GAR transformylase)